MSVEQALEEIEGLVWARRPAVAFERFAALLATLRTQHAALGVPMPTFAGAPLAAQFALCERACRAWGELMATADDLDPSKSPALPRLLAHLHMLHALAHGTAEGNLDAWLRRANARAGGNFNAAALARFVLLWVPGSGVDVDVFGFHRHLRTIVTAQAIATVAAMVNGTAAAHRAREAAIAFLRSGTPDWRDLAPLGFDGAWADAWMRCSYAVAPEKHEVKRFLNAMAAAVQYPVLPAEPRAVPDDRPVMVVPLESFASTHAMFRCYGPVLAKCREHFRTVVLVESRNIDAPAATIFDACHYIDRECLDDGALSLPRVIALVRSYNPALVFYPSLGMNLYTALLCNQRLAPVQAMSYGHPATSGSSCIDVGLAEQQWIGDPARYGERLVPLLRGVLHYAYPDGVEPPMPAPRADGDVVRIAVPSVCQKWTWPFLEALADVQRRARRRVEFRFFAGMQNMYYPAAANAVRRVLPEAVVYPYLSMPGYLARLRDCDIHAGTFPFGGTNSLIDSLLAGLPIVCVHGEEAQGLVDEDFVRRAGLPEWLIAPDAAGFTAALLRLVDEPGLLAVIRGELAARRASLGQQLLQDGEVGEFAEALRGLVGTGSASRSQSISRSGVSHRFGEEPG